jgi:thiol-disulfide isomerase/thioredoxin
MQVSGEVPAPAFALPTPDGRTIDLAGLRGKVVLLNFWATWCTPCREEMPSMERLSQEFKDQGLVVLAVNVQESPKRVALFMRGFRLGFPAVLDADTTVTARYQVRGLPATFLIDQRGRLVGQVIGARDWAGPPARALVRAILAGSGRPTASAPGR